MRTLTIKQTTDLQSIGDGLSGTAAAKQSTLQQMQRLNPHVDFARITPGTVLLMPRDTGAKSDDADQIGAKVFQAFEDQVNTALGAAETGIRAGHQALELQRKDVAAALKSAALKRLIESDPDLKAQLEAAALVFADDQKRAKESDAALQILRKDCLTELTTLGKLLG